MTWLIVRKELSGFFYYGHLFLPERSNHMSKRKIPPGLVELLEGFVLVVLRDKPKDLVEYASQYFTSAQTRKNFLKEHGASVEELGVDFFTATNWNGLVWLVAVFSGHSYRQSGSLCDNRWCHSCELYMCCADLQKQSAQEKTVVLFYWRKRNLSCAFLLKPGLIWEQADT